jgi:hypothetical protein
MIFLPDPAHTSIKSIMYSEILLTKIQDYTHTKQRHLNVGLISGNTIFLFPTIQTDSVVQLVNYPMGAEGSLLKGNTVGA